MSEWVVRFAAIAEADIEEACDYYAVVAPNEVGGFIHDVEVTQRRIADFPYLSREEEGLRHRAMTDYPYAPYYWLDEDNKVAWVVGVIHQRRNPAVAQSRNPKANN